MCNPNPSLLIVDDHPSQRFLFSQVSLKLGFNSIIVESGRRALESVQQNNFCVILMDVQMPDMSGLECTTRIREEEIKLGLIKTPIIAVTAHAFEHHKKACLEAGMNDYLAKPFFVEDLKTMVQRWLHVL